MSLLLRITVILAILSVVSASFTFSLGAALSILSVVSSGPVSVIYSCSEADYDSCDEELKVCLASRLQRDSKLRSCEQCYMHAFTCFKDCGEFPTWFERTCIDSCQPQYSGMCAPEEFDMESLGNGGGKKELSSIAFGLVIVAAGLLWA